MDTETFPLDIHLLLQLQLGSFELCHLAGNPLLLQLLLALPLILLILKEQNAGIYLQFA